MTVFFVGRLLAIATKEDFRGIFVEFFWNCCSRGTACMQQGQWVILEASDIHGFGVRRPLCRFPNSSPKYCTDPFRGA